ncbi:MAG: hypothetical protein Q9193_002612, partial [Seirophora villosa]
DHFSNILNEPAGKLAAAILTYVAPRILYAWQHPDIPLDQVLHDVERVFHHPAARDRGCEVHNTMFAVVERWAHAWRGPPLNDILGSESVRAGRNHVGSADSEQSGGQHNHGGLPSMSSFFPGGGAGGGGGGLFRDAPLDAPAGFDHSGPPPGTYAYGQQQQQPGYGNQIHSQPPYPSQPQPQQYDHGPAQQWQQHPPGGYPPQQQQGYGYGGPPPNYQGGYHGGSGY